MAESSVEKTSANSVHSFLDNSPYIPPKRDYSLEIGSLWENKALYWVGLDVGFHLGKCWLSKSENCQQYVDLIGGFAGRDADDSRWAAAALRWQLIDYPSPWSQFYKLIVGGVHSVSSGVIRNEPMVGVAYGLNRYLHKNVDLKIEARVGYTHTLYSQVSFGLQIKVDSWVEFFAEKIKGLGEKTIEATGGLLKKTGEVIITPFKINEKGNNKNNIQKEEKGSHPVNPN